MKKYKVKVIELHTDVVWVYAESKEEAKNEAQAQSDCRFDCVYDCEILDVQDLETSNDT